jgi:creatinine amidohydrolase
MFAEQVVLEATNRTNDIALPALSYGCSLGHTELWPGTLSLSVPALTAVIADIGKWVHASGFRKFVIVNSHATNAPPCLSALLTLRYEIPEMKARFVSLFDVNQGAAAGYSGDAEDPHANEAETSMMMHLRPELVHTDRAVDEVDRTVGRVMTYSMPQVTVSGVVGRPTSASAGSGKELLDVIVEGIAELLVRAGAETDPVL